MCIGGGQGIAAVIESSAFIAAPRRQGPQPVLDCAPGPGPGAGVLLAHIGTPWLDHALLAQRRSDSKWSCSGKSAPRLATIDTARLGATLPRLTASG